MKDLIYDQFQNKVDETLIRHANVLDIMTKFSDATSKTNRALVKTITECGCVTLKTTELQVPEGASYDELKDIKGNSLTSNLCPACREVIEKEMGNLQFYLAALCNEVDINLYDVMLKEYNRISTLGKFNLY